MKCIHDEAHKSTSIHIKNIKHYVTGSITRHLCYWWYGQVMHGVDKFFRKPKHHLFTGATVAFKEPNTHSIP